MVSKKAKSMITRQYAKGLIPFYNNKKVVAVENGNTESIIDTVLSDYQKSYEQSNRLAKEFKKHSVLATCEQVYNWVRENIKYVLDPKGKQYIKTPASVIHQGFADCKGLSILILSILENLGIKAHFRFAGYKNENVTHVYVRAYDEFDSPIKVDACLPQFNTEKPYISKKDVMTKVISINGIDDNVDGIGCKCNSIGGINDDEISGLIAGAESEEERISYIVGYIGDTDENIGRLRIGKFLKKVAKTGLSMVPGAGIIEKISENKKSGKKWWRGMAKTVALEAVTSAVPGGKAVKVGFKIAKGGLKIAKGLVKAGKGLKAAKSALKVVKGAKKLKGVAKLKNIVQRTKRTIQKGMDIYGKGKEFLQQNQNQEQDFDDNVREQYSELRQRTEDLGLDTGELENDFRNDFRQNLQEQGQDESNFEAQDTQEYQPQEEHYQRNMYQEPTQDVEHTEE